MGCMMRQIRLAKPWITDAEKQAVLDVMDSGWLTEGEKVAEFEEVVAKFVGVKHAIAVPNATLGLSVAIASVDHRIHGVVAVSAFTHPATALAAHREHMQVKLFDVSECDGNTTGQHVAECCDRFRPDVIVPVSWGGTALEEDVYLNARAYCVPVIEDCACGLGAINSSGQNAGSQALVSVLSFHPRKLITTCEGGMVLTNDDDIAEYIRKTKNFSGPVGTNLKMSDINAAVGVAQMDRIYELISDRVVKARLYNSLLRDAGLPAWYRPTSGDQRSVYQSYCVLVDHRDRLIVDLAALGIETQIGTYDLSVDPRWSHSFHSLYIQHSHLLGDRLLTLPLHHEITEEDQEFVVESIVSLLKSYEV